MSNAIRKRIRAERRNLSDREKLSLSIDAAQHVVRDNVFLTSTRLAFYLASDGELDTLPLIDTACKWGKSCHLPVITDRLQRFRTSPLQFQTFDPGSDDLVANRFGILEPRLNPHHFVRPEMLDIIFVPLVAFDRFGTRLGMGAGFYDRTLACLGNRFRRPWLIGLAYSFQEVGKISANAWDIPLDAIATDEEMIWIG